MTPRAGGGRGARRLSPEERELWRNVTRAVKPIRPEVAEALPAARAAPDNASAPLPAPLPRPPPTAKAKPEQPVPPPPLTPLGRRLKGRVARGAEPIDGRLDLHGLTQAQAYDALQGFLRGAQARNAKLVLVITGKGARSSSSYEGSEARGVLRQLVPRWLAMPDFRAAVVAFETAHTGHGGEGALYVRLRRSRASSADGRR